MASNPNVKEKTLPRISEVKKEREQVATPKNYKVLLLNNETTDFDAVVDVLRHVFAINLQQASQIMIYAHNNGQALVMISTKEICEQKVVEARNYCLANAHRTRGNRSMYYEHLQFDVEEDDANGN